MYLLKKLRKNFKVVTIVLLIALCLTTSKDKETTNSLTQIYAQTYKETAKTHKYAQAMSSCTPKGGAAVEIYLSDQQREQQNREKPRVLIFIYEDISKISEKTFDVGKDSNTGQAAFCPPIGDCFYAKSGTVVIKSVLPDKSVIGEYDLEFSREYGQAGTFQTTWVNSKTPCLQVK